MGRPSGWLFFFSLFRLVFRVSALGVNTTIDDQFGDQQPPHTKPTFSPPSAWVTQKCTGCAIKPEASKMHGATFTAATFMPDNMTSNAIDFHFNGTAVYIFFTLFNFEGEGVAVNTECNFTIDGLHVGYFNHRGDPSLPFTRFYQVPVFSHTGLDQNLHHMSINTSGINYDVYTSFDFAIYTTEIDATTTMPSQQPTPPSGQPVVESKDHPNHSAPIVGGVLGGLGFLLGFLVAFWFYRRFQLEKRKAPTLKPFSAPASDTSPNAELLLSRSLNGGQSQPLLSQSFPQAVHGHDTSSTLSSLWYLSPSERRSVAGHTPNTSIQNRSMGSTPVSTGKVTASHTSQPPEVLEVRNEGSTGRAPNEVAEEIWRLRAELTRLEESVTHSQVHVPGGGEAPPAYQ